MSCKSGAQKRKDKTQKLLLAHASKLPKLMHFLMPERERDTESRNEQTEPSQPTLTVQANPVTADSLTSNEVNES